MSSAWSMAAVTVIIKNVLENALIEQAGITGMGDVVVSALPPDRISIGAEERPQLNLYLYRLTPDSGWRPTAQDAGRQGQVGQEPGLLLKLHYLLSAYGERDAQAEILLGTALHCLQEAALIRGERLSGALKALASARSGQGQGTPAALARMAAMTPLEEIRISPEFLSLEDLTKLWSSLQAHARLSMTYQVSVLLSAPSSAERGRVARAAR
jgi:hypothetical protein